MINLDSLLPADGEVWHPWWAWEEMSHNMWGVATHRKTWVEMAVAFTGNAELYGEWMLKVIQEWPASCEHNLTKPGDKRPWMGHAAVALAIGCPEDIVREAWGLLTEKQQIAANAKAQRAIDEWRGRNAENVSRA
jgi:hypothetical protein